MATWTITAPGGQSYAGADLVDVIEVRTAGFTSLDIRVQQVASFLVPGAPGPYLDLTLRGGTNNDYLNLSMGGAAYANLSNLRFEAGWASPTDRVTVFGSGIAAETAIGSTGDDVFAMSKGTDSVDGWSGMDTLQVQAGTGIGSANAWRTVGGNVLTNGADTTTTFAGIEAFSISTGTGADTLVGLAGDDRIWTGANDDSVSGGTGNDRLVLGDGFDTAEGGWGDDRTDLGGGRDRAYGGEGQDSLLGGDMNNILYGDGGNDTLLGGQGVDLLEGGAGDDTLDGGTGADQMYGREGDDLYLVDDPGEWIYEFAGEGWDRIASAGSANLANMGGSDVGAVEVLELTGTGRTWGYGNGFNNTILGTTGQNVLGGRGGRDELDLRADAAADTVRFQSVTESRGTGFDTVLNMDLGGEDRFMIRLRGGVDVDTAALRGGGSLSTFTFLQDIAARLDPFFTAGGGVQAFLWDPAAGDYNRAGDRWLVVDADDSGAFEAASDLLVLVRGATGTMDIGDFIGW